LQRAGPGVERVVIAVRDKNWDVVVGQRLQSTAKLELRLQTFILAVKHITRNDDGVHLLPNRQIDDIQKRLQGSLAQTLGPLRMKRGKPLERAVDMQIGTMNETKGGQNDSLQKGRENKKSD
jgi:hypothetical protein